MNKYVVIKKFDVLNLYRIDMVNGRLSEVGLFNCKTSISELEIKHLIESYLLRERNFKIDVDYTLQII